MNAYLVRLKSNQELVGLFLSPDEEGLWEYVDECTDPDACEFIELPPGSLFHFERGAPRVPTIERYPEDDEKIPDWFAGAILSELWLDAFYGDSEGWEPIEPIDEEVT